MKSFSEILKEQTQEVKKLRNIIYSFTDEKIAPNDLILGSLLTGSIARGDARIGPFGIAIDITIIVNRKMEINLSKIFGADEKPLLPYHCVLIQDKIWVAINTIEEKDLWETRTKDESTIFAMNESIILDDKKRILVNWKKATFNITQEQVKERALQQYFRFCYLTGEYRIEKWSYRKAWIQIMQNLNEANECYCNFLFCINKMFIPRKDWLTYLTFEMEIKPQKHQEYLEKMYEALPNETLITKKLDIYNDIYKWMKSYIEENKWL